eukprot:TRINITY_DN342_c0_g1_i2.p1 TRINITY_DN342_c0_g1~~TRINITY_DN342_c0_g1_i2.p1  ORF type:complete len:177 (+),score=48.29 TRINITY_DN342_c0_g1_i2:88-618(+)
MNAQKLAQLRKDVRIGGKGSMRRKKKIRRNKNTSSDDKRANQTFKRLGCQPLQQIEEINMFKDDGTVIHFTNPKFQANGRSNLYVVSGKAEVKQIRDLLPGIIDQLPPAQGDLLRGLAGDQDDDDIPDLVADATADANDDDDMPPLVAADDATEAAKAGEGEKSEETDTKKEEKAS